MSSDKKGMMEFAHHLPVNVHSLPRTGKEMCLVSDAPRCAHLARNHGLVAVEHFEARFHLVPRQRGSVQLRGSFTAHLVQHCVVSGEAMRQQIHDNFTLLFVPQAERVEDEGEVILNIDNQDEEEQEFYDGTSLDLGAVVEEFFELALDPYPRKEGGAFQPVQIGDEDGQEASDSPFALLKHLPKSGSRFSDRRCDKIKE